MTAEELSRKRMVRGAHRSSAVRLMGQADTRIGAMPIDMDELTLLQASLSSKLTVLEALDTEIVVLTPEDQLEEEIAKADNYSERVRRTLLFICKALESATRAPLSPPVTPPVTRDTPHDDTSPPLDMSVTTTTESTIASSKVKLPKISLPHFRGNPIYWTAFWDSYESAIHLNSALTDVDKFNYLRSLLEKSAYEAIAGLTLSSANYHEAIEILKKCFGNRPMIISRHMEVLLNLTGVSGEHDLRGLRR